MATTSAITSVDGIGKQSLPGTLTRLLELTSDGVMVLDGSGTVIHANDRARRLLGAVDPPVGRHVADLLCRIDDGVPATSSRDYGGDVSAAASGPDADELPFPIDGTRIVLETRGSGLLAKVAVRCDTVSAPGGTLLLVMHELPKGHAPSSTQRDELADELAAANRRLTGILRVVLGTLDTQDMSELLDKVLGELASAMAADGSVAYLADGEGFRLRAVSGSLDAERMPRYLAYGHGIETVAVNAGHAVRLHVLAPEPSELRAGRLASRVVSNEETGELRRIPSRLLPPLSSAIVVPVWFGGHVIALIMVGWKGSNPLSRDDARLLDAIGQYLSTQIMGAITAMRTQRSSDLNAATADFRDGLAGLEGLGEEGVRALLGRALTACDLSLARVDPNGEGCLRVTCGDDECDVDLSTKFLYGEASDDDVVVVPLGPDSSARDVAEALARAGMPSSGALVDLGEIGGGRRVIAGLRDADVGPADDIELAYLHRIADLLRDAVTGERVRMQDRRIAQALQLGMRNELQDVEGIRADAIYSSATADAFVGGDFYDLIRLPGHRACVIMGDVSGKGVEAASVSAAVKTALGAYAWQGLSPACMVRTLNRFLLGFSRIETFATMFVGIVDLSTLELTYCSAGHPPALLVRAGGTVLEGLDVQSGVVGAFEEIRYRDGRVSLSRGDTLLLYTDGTTEARNRGGEFFGERGLREAVLAECADHGPEGLLDGLLARLDAFTGRNLEDDVAMVELTFEGKQPE